MNPTNPHESSRILSTIVQKEPLKIWISKSWILTNADLRTCAANPDLQVWTLKICIADLIHRPVFKRFVSWIQFVRPKISYSIRINSEGFVYESHKLKLYLFRRWTIFVTIKFKNKDKNYFAVASTWGDLSLLDFPFDQQKCSQRQQSCKELSPLLLIHFYCKKKYDS